MDSQVLDISLYMHVTYDHLNIRTTLDGFACVFLIYHIVFILWESATQELCPFICSKDFWSFFQQNGLGLPVPPQFYIQNKQKTYIQIYVKENES